MIESAVTLFPQPELANDAERLPGPDREAHPIDRAERSAFHRERNAQILHREQRSRHNVRDSRGSSQSRSPSPSRLTARTRTASAMPGQKIVHGAMAR